jgi:hypothetical protein
MKLSDHVDEIRRIIDSAFRNRLGRMGIIASSVQPIESIPQEYELDRKRIDSIHQVLLAETGKAKDAYEKLIEEFTFTLFNRVAALKVMEAHGLHAEIVTRRSMHGDRSFAHKDWLEHNPEGRNDEMEGLVRFMEQQLSELAADIPLFSPQNPFHLLPTAIELNGILLAFNKIETDPQVETDIWQSDDVLGWLYESYNNLKKLAHKESGDKTEYHKVSLQSQVYTPRWVVKFLVDNSLGKLYLEMFPNSEIKDRYKIANAPKIQTRVPKPLTEIKLIDPAPGSGNFLLYAFDLFYDMYKDQVENYGADYDDKKIPELIIAHNLHGVDLDDRAIQLAQLGLYIKAKRKKRSVKIDHFNIVSSDFFLPEYKEVKHLFENGEPLAPELETIVIDIWSDLQQAYKFGSLIRLEERFNTRLKILEDEFKKPQLSLLAEPSVAYYQDFRKTFFTQLHKAVAQNTIKQGQTFLNIKTQDAITFLQLLTQKYDIAVANPPYTDSADFGPDLKKFVDANYKEPYKFNSNLYAAFISRCFGLINMQGKMALIHPMTFMYIKSFEDVRKFILEKMHINILVEFGEGGLFPSHIFVDPAFYIFESKNNTSSDSLFISLDQYSNSFNQNRKKEFLFDAIDNYLKSKSDEHIFKLDQEKLKVIEDWPFIYWVSDGFREKFKFPALGKVLNPRQGIATGNNDKCVRYWWEVAENDISTTINDDKKWKFYAKGGPYNKWSGNLWTVIDYSTSGYDYLLNNGNHLPSRDFYFKEGITYSASGQKGACYRYLPENLLFDVGGSCIFMGDYSNLYYSIAFLNSNLSFYIAQCLNPTVNTQVGDIKRIPFATVDSSIEQIVSALSAQNIAIKQSLQYYRVVEKTYSQNILSVFTNSSLYDRILDYFNYENVQNTLVLLNEAIINHLIFKVYDLSEEDKKKVEKKMGILVGDLPVLKSARQAFLIESHIDNDYVKMHIEHLMDFDFDGQQIQQIKIDLGSLYQSNNDLETFCINHQVNPINVWYWFKENKVLPQSRTAEIALEFITEAFRSILIEDEDGIIPLVGLPGEPRLMDRFEQYCFRLGFSSAQFMQLDGLLGNSINQFIEHHFFNDLGNLLNLFRYLPKTPFIWHISSGVFQGFEAYIIIYKWNRDSLYKLKSSYLSKRTESLQYRKQQIDDSTSAQAQTEKETIRLQLQEIEAFAAKIDELIAEGYNPKLDDGVAKNIAPLQKKGMLRAEVLKSAGTNSQLQKYLNADW